MAEETEYNEDLKIDKYHLDEEWEDQPLLYMKWAERYAEAIHERDQLKEKMDLIRAQIDIEIRINPNTFGFDRDKKPTESAISNRILEEEEYQTATEEFLSAKKSVNILQGVKEAMEHKKKALEAETSLFIGGFYSEPKIPQKAREDSSKAITESIRRRLPRRKTK